MAEIKIIITEDGSHSLYNDELKETYHSFHGAIRESLHVFIDKGLKYFRTKEGLPKEINIFEVGFGTGLNAFLSAQFAVENDLTLHYQSLEPFPLSANIYEALNYSQEVSQGKYESLFKQLHESDWEVENEINRHFRLLKQKNTLQNIDKIIPADVVFFDAFAPSKQAEMWDISLLKKCFDLLKPSGVFVTYSAKGQLKRDLKQVGFEVETIPGPPGKKEMVRGIKN